DIPMANASMNRAILTAIHHPSFNLFSLAPSVRDAKFNQFNSLRAIDALKVRFMGKGLAMNRMEMLLNISLSEHSLLSVLAKSNGLLHIYTTWKKAGQGKRLVQTTGRI